MSAVLTDIDTVEVSLVARGANRQRFALRKNQGKESTMTTEKKGKITKAMLTEMEAGARSKVLQAIKLLASVGGELPEGLLQAMVEELGIEDTASMLAAMEQPSGATEPPADTLAPDAMNTEEYMTADKSMKKTELTDAAKSEIAKAQKAAADATAEIAALKKSATDGEAKRVELEKQVKAERDARLEREYLAKAEKLPHVPTKAAELGPILKALHDASPDVAAKVEKVLEGANEKLAKVLELTKELGHGHQGGDDKTAWSEVTKAAAELRKSNTKLTEAQSIDLALKANPALYEQYNKEQAERS
jgi:hypothetical protein